MAIGDIVSLFANPTPTPAYPTTIFMSLEVSCMLGPDSKSFEEVRLADYFSSYAATGRPPTPYINPRPDLSLDDELTRRELGLPPLFRPPPDPPVTLPPGHGLLLPRHPQQSGEKLTAEKPNAVEVLLSKLQPFTHPILGYPHIKEPAVLFTSITADPKYWQWSFEELRYHAYTRGLRTSPPDMPRFVFTPANNTGTSLSWTSVRAFGTDPVQAPGMAEEASHKNLPHWPPWQKQVATAPEVPLPTSSGSSSFVPGSADLPFGHSFSSRPVNPFDPGNAKSHPINPFAEQSVRPVNPFSVPP
ncbi:hypothetical protein R3P38DRAFT_3259595 [Favolaschia claudopus]|uniref:Uncharacterized protein n=1 Tax=Favolaschia claudopus TaxID=2862362 RepID=A0AAW0CYX0_9AGAR